MTRFESVFKNEFLQNIGHEDTSGKHGKYYKCCGNFTDLAGK